MALQYNSLLTAVAAALHLARFELREAQGI
jgi:hypothetical protein